MKLKSLDLLLILCISLVPLYFFYKFLQKRVRPRESPERFFLYLLAMFTIIFLYTYILVLLVKLAFPKA